MARSRSIIIAGAGIGGLTAALAIARAGYRVVVLEQAERLEETGAGIQLSPNASRVLIELGLRERLAPLWSRRRRSASSTARPGARHRARPLGDAAEQRYGAPYWVIHRADLQSVLVAAVEANPTSSCGSEPASTTSRSTARRHGGGAWRTWHTRRARPRADRRRRPVVAPARPLGDGTAPRFARRTAWRAMVPAER